MVIRNLSIGVLVAAGVCVAGCGILFPMPSSMDTARVRVVHASPDAPAVGVCVDGSVAFDNVTFPSATDYAALSPATYAVRVIPAGVDCGSAGVIDADLPLAADSDTTVVALDLLADIAPLVLSDNNSSPQAGNAKVRFVHASPDAPTVDVTLTNATTLFNDVSFKGSGGYIEVAAGTYDLQVRDETGTTVVLTLDDVSVSAGEIYTIYAVGLLAGNPDLDALITLDSQ